jgi:nitrite reductase/ring-hydroxylating ferredoxin subunit
MTQSDSRQPLPRRAILAGVAGVAVLAGCGSDTASGTGAASTDGAATQPTGGAALGAKTDIPIGGGKIFSSQQVVVTQPVSGEFKAFSAICTHQGCAVTNVSNGEIICPCHNSRFSIADGSVQTGPATQALPSVAITANGDNLSLG